VSRQILSEIIEARSKEMFDMLDLELTNSGYRDIITSGIVLTGGASAMEGIADLAESVFQCPVRVGTPIGLGGLIDVVNNPMYATSTGLIQYGLRADSSGKTRQLQGRNMFEKIFSRMRDWAEEFF
jgi:cell division protein FtsA